eukprot:TRINITY_DN68114_c2_g1_i1.p2 TRINITY_DN68114_c2_g1~~TRINITY_DN68114_c2_g1_i1.p2  ORF type:complete len:172 (-),score=41.70 TRINITY_DN68114_c2_g1_i1:33-548(-)
MNLTPSETGGVETELFNKCWNASEQTLSGKIDIKVGVHRTKETGPPPPQRDIVWVKVVRLEDGTVVPDSVVSVPHQSKQQPPPKQQQHSEQQQRDDDTASFSSITTPPPNPQQEEGQKKKNKMKRLGLFATCRRLRNLVFTKISKARPHVAPVADNNTGWSGLGLGNSAPV